MTPMLHLNHEARIPQIFLHVIFENIKQQREHKEVNIKVKRQKIWRKMCPGLCLVPVCRVDL